MFFKKNKKHQSLDEATITEQEIQWQAQKELIQRQKALEGEYKQLTSKKKKMTTTKWLMLFLLLNCTAIEIFTGWCTYQSLRISQEMGTYVDFSPLVTLIGAVVGEVIGLAVYAFKSTKENTKGGIVYEQAMLDRQEEEQEKESGVG